MATGSAKTSRHTSVHRHTFCLRGLGTHARKLDERVACKIALSIQSGVLVNSHNEAYHRTARNATRHTTTIRKSRESHELANERARIELEVEAEKRESVAWLKALQMRKSATRKTKSGRTCRAGSTARSETRTVFVSANSSIQQNHCGDKHKRIRAVWDLGISKRTHLTAIRPAARHYFNIIWIALFVLGTDSKKNGPIRSPGMYDLEIEPYKFG
ncbi:hypothetical protein B0H13DRAFT_1889324 [Mycena leptocephala]|nr:hypothetical protein B0H13DRAFT_1889324 [Mycena leptocephala]